MPTNLGEVAQSKSTSENPGSLKESSPLPEVENVETQTIKTQRASSETQTVTALYERLEAKIRESANQVKTRILLNTKISRLQGEGQREKALQLRRARRLRQLNEVDAFLRTRLLNPGGKPIKDVTPLIKDPEYMAGTSRSKWSQIRDAMGTMTGLLGIRNTERGYILNIFNRSHKIVNDRLTQWGLDLTKIGTIYDRQLENSKTTWRSFLLRLPMDRSNFHIALDGRKEMSTEDMAFDENGIHAVQGLSANPVGLHFNVKGKDATDVNSTIYFHHQINAEPAGREFANKISTKDVTSDSALARVANTINKAITVLTSNDHKFVTTRKGVLIEAKGIDFFETGLESAILTDPIQQEYLSFCFNGGYEILYKIHDETGKRKSVEQIENDLKVLIRAAKTAQELKNVTQNEDTPKTTKRRIHRSRKLAPQLIDVTAASASAETRKAVRPIVNKLKRHKTSDSESRFDQLTKSLLRVSLNVNFADPDNTSQTANEIINKAKKNAEELSAIGAVELFEGVHIPHKHLLTLEEIAEQIPSESIVSADISEELGKAKNLMRTYLETALSSHGKKLSEEQETLIQYITGDAKIIEAILFALGGHPVNIVQDDIEHGLAISNSRTENDPTLKTLRTYYNNLCERKEHRYQISPEHLEGLRVHFIETLMRSYVSMEKAKFSESINHHLIQASHSFGVVMSKSALFRGILKYSSLILGATFPQYHGGEQFLEDLKKVRVFSSPERAAADFEMILTRILGQIEDLEEDTIGTTVSKVYSHPEGAAGIGTTASYTRGANVAMITQIGEKRYLTVRGHEAKKMQTEMIEGLKILQEIFN